MHRAKAVFEGSGLSGVLRGRASLGYDPDAILPGDGAERVGFSGTCETTLTDWIQLVQMGRRDAVVSLRGHDGKEGTLWCRGGDIIDAACDGLTGEDAVYRALTWRGGKVSVDFSDFSHRRQIQMATAGLLLGAAYRKDAAADETAHPQPATASGTNRAATAGLPRSAGQKVRRPTMLLLAVAGGFLALVLTVGLVSKWVSPARSPVPASGAPVPELLVRIEANPANAAIVLDGKQVGVGKLDMALPRDGRAHEILYSAPGYVSERVDFRDAPPRQRVILLRDEEAGTATVVAAARAAPVRRDALAQSAAAANGTAAHRRAAKNQGKRAVPGASDVESLRAQSAPANANVQIIEDHRPVVQIIDEPKPRIDVIQ